MEERAIARVMPSSLESEQSIIGAVLLEPKSINEIMDKVKPGDFYYKKYAIIFEKMVELSNEGAATDFVTVYEALRKDSVGEEVISIDELKALTSYVPTSANIKDYAAEVHEKAILRNIIKLNEDISQDCYANKDVDIILDEVESKVFKLIQSKGSNQIVPFKDLIKEVVAKTNLASKNPEGIQGVTTGFVDLDRKLSGLQPSDFILIAARPSMGKTAFVLNIAEYAAVKKRVPTAIFSLEMSDVQLTARLVSMESGVDSEKMRSGNMSSTDWGNLAYGTDLLSKGNIIIDDTPGISISEMRSRCRKYKQEHNLGLVIIDYLQLMSGSKGKSSESRQQEISEISRGLKAIARELNVPVLALSQLSRAPEQRQDHRPILSDLRESGAIEQDADVVMFIYRDDYYNEDTEEKNIAEIHIAKQRNGPLGTVKLAWIPEQTKFENLALKNDNFE